MWHWVIGGIITLITAGSVAYVVYNWDTFIDKIRHWLSRNGLENSILAKAFVHIDRVIVAGRRRIRSILKIKRKDKKRVTTIETVEYDFGSDEYIDLNEELAECDSIRKNLIHMI